LLLGVIPTFGKLFNAKNTKKNQFRAKNAKRRHFPVRLALQRIPLPDCGDFGGPKRYYRWGECSQ
jgi:hypothetical protein